MDIKVKLNNIRIAPRKSREAIDLIRGKDVIKARAILEFTVKRAAEPILKLLNSAVAAASHNFQLKDTDLYISKITVDEGPKLKRWHPMSRGRAYPILKRTSHITLVISEKNPTENKKEKIKAKPEKEVIEKPKKVRKPRKTSTIKE